MKLVQKACVEFKRQNPRFSAYVETPRGNELWKTPAFLGWRYHMRAITIDYTHCNPRFGDLDFEKAGRLSGSGLCWPFPEGVEFTEYGCQCRKRRPPRVHRKSTGSDLADAAVYPEPTARAFAEAVSRSRVAAYGGLDEATFEQYKKFHDRVYERKHGFEDRKRHDPFL